MRSGSALVTDTIGGRSPSAEMPRRRATSVPAAPISWASASSSTSLAPPALQRLDGQHALGVPGHRHRRGGRRGPGPDGSGRGWRRSGSAGRRAPRPPPRSAAWRWAPARRRPARGPTAAARSRSAARRRVRRRPAPAAARPHRPGVASSDSMPAEVTSSSRVSSHALALAAEGHGVGLAGVEPVDQRSGAGHLRSPRRAVAGGQPVVLVDRHLVSPLQLVVVAFRVSTCAALRRCFLGDSPSNHGARRSPPVEGSGGHTGCTKSVIRTSTIFQRDIGY